MPSQPTLSTADQLECTERALVGRVCDLNPDALTEVGYAGRDPSFIVEMGDPNNPWLKARFSYLEAPTFPFEASVSCTIPAGGNTRVGHVSLSVADWRLIASAGSVLPAALAPDALDGSPGTYTAPPSSVPSTTSGDASADTCSVQAVEVFGRLARHQITLAQAQQQLPAGIPRSALTTSLQGVRNYEADGLSQDDAITEAGGAVGQACPR